MSPLGIPAGGMTISLPSASPPMVLILRKPSFSSSSSDFWNPVSVTSHPIFLAISNVSLSGSGLPSTTASRDLNRTLTLGTARFFHGCGGALVLLQARRPHPTQQERHEPVAVP